MHLPLVIEFLGYDLSEEDGEYCERLRAKLHALGLTQVEFGHLLGVSRETINGWRKGRRLPTGTKLERPRKVLLRGSTCPRLF